MEFNFLVSVEVERDSGLHASRDDIAELISTDLGSAAESVAMSGLGPRYDSDYSVSQVNVDALDKRALKAANAEYEELVVAEAPSDAELRSDLKVALAKITSLQNDVKSLNRQLQQERDNRDIASSSIWFGGGWDDEKKTFLPDGPHDRVYFRHGERDDERFSVERKSDGSLEVRSDAGFGGFAVKPVSGNVVQIIAGER